MASQRSDRYLEAKAIVHAVLELPTAERAAFVDQRCGEDPALCEEVRWLWQTIEGDDSPFLDHDPLLALDPDADEVVQVRTPHHYRIVRRFGEGGQGVVFLADRSDGIYHQKVALKLLHVTGQLSPSRMSRFLTEGQILAQLNHPNIAHLIDAGNLPGERPFLAMEFVDGLPITAYCTERKLGVEQRIQLYLKVCAAVGYAHQQLIIHRDLKPANILVTDEGEPKLLDFGIARLLTAQDAAAAPATEDGQRLLTPTHASPEQIRGEKLSTVSDVYSLGILLYELLAGKPPFTSDSGDAMQLNYDICETEPTRPSRSIIVAKSAFAVPLRKPLWRRWLSKRQRISPDLDAITLKALRKRPQDRYESVHALISDLKRYLSHRPVLARRGRFSYFARRYLQRNRWAVAAAVTFAVLVIGFAANRQFELRRTQLERDKAQQLANFMSDLFRDADPSQSRGATITVREMLDRGARETMARDRIDPRLKASMLVSIGKAYSGLGLSRDAIPPLASALRLYKRSEASPEEQGDALIQLGQVYSQTGDYKTAIAHYDAAVALLRSVAGDHTAMIDRAQIERAMDRVQLADAPLSPLIADLKDRIHALEIRPSPPDELLPLAYETLGVAYASSGDDTAAAAALERAVKGAIAQGGTDSPLAIDLRAKYAKALEPINPAQAATLLQAALADYVRVVGEHNMNYAIRLNDLAVALGDSGQKERSIAIYNKARGIARTVAGPTDRYYLQLTGNLAMQLIEQDRKAEAVGILQETLPVLASRVDTGIDRLVYAHALYALGAAWQGRDEAQAEHYFLQAEHVLGPAGPAGYFNVYEAILDRLTQTRIRLGHYQDAEQSLAKLKNVERTQPPSPDPRSRGLQIDLMLAYKRYREAAQLAAAGFAATRGPDGKCSAQALHLREQYTTAIRMQADKKADPDAPLPLCAPDIHAPEQPGSANKSKPITVSKTATP